MEKNTPCCIGIFSSVPLIEGYVADYRAVSKDTILTSSAHFEKAVEVAKEWEKRGVEVLISRRGTGELLRKSVASPVLSLPFSELEVLHNLKTVCPKGSRVMVTVYREAYPNLQHIGDALGITFLQGVYRTHDELREVVRKAVANKVDAIAGGMATQDCALVSGMPFFGLFPSKDQILNALESAHNVAASNREKEVFVSELKYMMNAMPDGLVTVGRNGNVLNANAPAMQLLGRKSSTALLGQSFVPYIGKQVFDELIRGSQVSHESVIDFNESQIVLNVSAIKSKHAVERLFVTLRKSQDIMRQSGALRSFISRGFVTNYRLRDVIHKGRAMHDIITLGKAYAKTMASLLILGETGTGKEMLAQGIHNHSARGKNPFVSVNCAELPESLLESELFGHSEGAFTGSRKGGKAGLFELAHTGTIFLDEIDSAPPLVQNKLLRVLQEKEIMRVGGTRKIPVDVRVIAATGRELWEQVCAGTFRKDLFFRLNVMSIRIPPLRERVEDIDVLLPHFLSHFSQREGITPVELRPDQIKLLKQYAWPGNVRQLRHLVERYVLHSTFMSDPFSLVYDECRHLTMPSSQAPAPLSSLTFSPPRISEPPAASPPPADSPAAPLIPNLRNVPDSDRKRAFSDPDALRQVLEYARYSKKDAALFLGVSRSTLWRKMKELGLSPT